MRRNKAARKTVEYGSGWDQALLHADQRRVEEDFKKMEIIRFRRLATWLMDAGVDCLAILKDVARVTAKRNQR